MNVESSFDEDMIDLVAQIVMDKLEERQAAQLMAAQVMKRVLQTQQEEAELGSEMVPGQGVPPAGSSAAV